MGYLNNIFNSLRVISEGDNYSTTGFTVTYSGTGLPIPAGSNTSFMVRDGGYVGIGTNLPKDGLGGNANLHVVGNARVTNIPTGGKNYLTTDVFGNILQNTSTPIIPTISGDCVITSAYTAGISGCTLYLITSCTGNTAPGRLLVNGYVSYTADTCGDFIGEASPYRYGLGAGAIEPKLNSNNATSPLSSIGGGQFNNTIGGSAYSRVGGGLSNLVQNDSVFSSILGGSANQVNFASYSNVGGGFGNKVLSSSHSSIVGGMVNIITGTSYGAIVNGVGNRVRHQNSVILGMFGGLSDDTYTTYVSGLNVNSGANAKYLKYHGALANPGLGKVLVDSTGLGDAVWSNGQPGATWTGDCAVVSAFTQGCLLYMMTDCTGSTVGAITVNGRITYTADTCNQFGTGPYEYADGGFCSTNSIQPKLGLNAVSAYTSNITGGIWNRILGGCNTLYTGIEGGGFRNTINAGSYYSSILGGYKNHLGITTVPHTAMPAAASSLVNIIGGQENRISGGTYSTIIGGKYNKVIGTTSQQVSYGVVINGQSNTVKHEGSVIMNGPNFTTDDSYTTYTRGLNVNSVNSTGGAKYLKYHGALANPGFGKVLVDSTGFGDAVWADGGTYTFSGDQYVTSAYTSGCTLYIVTNSGNTFTADTCNTFGGTSPYEYRGGVNSISTVLPGFGVVGDNYIKNSMAYSNIGGGAYNKLNTSGPGYNNIAGGLDNTIGGSNIKFPEGASGYDFIGGGYKNKIRGYDQFYAVIGGGYKNWVLNSQGGFIGGGIENIITGGTISFIGAGGSNKIFKPYGSIVGGRYNAIYANYSNIGGGQDNTVGSPIGGNTAYAGIFNGSGNTIGRNAEYAAIIGSRGINYADNPETTYLKGLDANTNGYNGIDRPFKYHGSYANPGPAKVLTSDGVGNASWQNAGWLPGLTGDCVVSTAYTVNCILYMVTNCTGATAPGRLLVNGHLAYTANTCQSFGGNSPYEYGTGTGSIQPILGLNQSNTWYSIVSGGYLNAAHYGSHYGGIHGGYSNTMTAGTYSTITNGQLNIIKNGTFANIGSGRGNYIGAIDKTPTGQGGPLGTAAQRDFIGAGDYNEILQSDNSNIVSGQYNLLRLTYQSFIGSGDHNILTGQSNSVLVGGYYNTMKNSLRSFIGGGSNHEMYDSAYNTIVGGTDHHMNNASNYNFIGGGDSNVLGDTTAGGLNTDYSSILGGKDNTIQGDSDADFAAIVNGRSNTVTANYAAIIGGQSLTANRTHTTFMNGLDVDVASSSGTRLFRYHGVGSFAGSAGDVLTSINTLGDAIWSTPTAPGASFTGDCAVVSAYTSGCTLFMVTDCTGATGTQYILQGGNVVYTANTCNSSGTGPYRYGTNSGIEPILGGNNSDGFRSSIGGGQNNRVGTNSAWSNVGAGVTNTITDSRVSSILGGHQNTINIPGIGSGYGAIINGYQNQVTHEYSVVMGGSGIVSDKSFTTFMNGLDVDTNATGGVNRYFKYHGTLAAPGLNNVLTDVDGTGNAVWRKPQSPNGTVTWSGDQYVTSAYTQGCTLYITTNSGNTFTADTCNTFNDGPYTIGSGVNSIRPKLGVNQVETLYSNIQGGFTNKILSGTTAVGINTYNSILGGAYNTITGSPVSTIVSGQKNKIYIGESGMHGYGAILNGYENKVNHHYSVIMGGANITTDREFTVFMRGLDVNTTENDPFGPPQELPFKYHGGYANPGLNKILVSDAVGNAHWENLSTPGVSFSGDQYVVSAYTTGCTLFVTTNSGNTYTANTCNEFSDSPYEYRGFNSISTKLPGSGNLGDNYIRTNTPWSNINGGLYNKINTYGPGYNHIGSGYDNTIGGSDITVPEGNTGYVFIGGGYKNKVRGADQYYAGIGSGYKNWVLNSQQGFIAAGKENIITGATGAFIGSGNENIIWNNGEASTIVAGTRNTIYSNGSIIGAGIDNTIGAFVGGTTAYAGIVNGSGNTIGRNAEYAAIIGAKGITADDPETTYMRGLNANTNGAGGIDRPFKYHGTYANHGVAGYVLTAADASGNAHWQPGSGIPSTGSDEVVISADTSGCTITFFTNSGNTFTANTCNGGYSPYRPTGTNSIVPTLPGIGVANENIISANSDWSNIGGGSNNRITQGSDRSVVAGGQYNRIVNSSNWSNIAGGVNNEIDDSRVSSILGGHQNNINIPGTSNGYGAIVGGYSNEVTGTYSTIVNGYNNTASQSYTTILNGVNVTTNLSHTAYIKGGINIDTQASTPRYFRYHGTLANEGASKILTSDANGNATWQNSGMVGYSGDQFVVSAYTTGCTLHIITNSGNTFTASTCNTHDNSPYEYDLGSNSIVPKLPSLPGWKNTIGMTGGNSVIAGGLDNNISGNQGNTISGGYYNDIGSTHSWGSIVGGYANKLTGTNWEQCTAIVGGWNNEIYNQQRSFIAGGKDNLIFRTVGGAAIDGHSSIIGGTANNISGATHSSIIGGENHVLRSEANYSVILGGGSAITGSTPSTAYMTNSQTMGKARIASHNYLSTNGLHNQSPKTALDFVHETSNLTGMAINSGGGEIVRFGSTGGDYAAGYLVQLQAGTWVKADAADVLYQGNMLGIALGATPEKGILIRGHYVIQTAYEYTGAESVGEPLYVSFTDGMIRNVVPTTAGQYVRAVGYIEQVKSASESVVIYFNPDSTYITLT